MSDDLNGDFLVADEKIDQGTTWQDTMSVPVAGEKLEFGFTLLDERINQRVQSKLPLDEFRDYKQGGMSDEQERMMELQREDDLTEEEQQEFLELAEEVNPEEEGRDTLGQDAVNALMKAGKHALIPTEGDVKDVMALDPPEQEEMFGEIPEGGKDVFREELGEYMEERVENQPFPIKFTLGQRAFMETVSVTGNGFQST